MNLSGQRAWRGDRAPIFASLQAHGKEYVVVHFWIIALFSRYFLAIVSAAMFSVLTQAAPIGSEGTIERYDQFHTDCPFPQH